jgi:hypothetical protein
MPIPLGILAVAGAGSGAAASDFELLETTVLGSDAASVTFSSLGSYSAYKHLQIRASMKSGSGTTGTSGVFIRLNGATGSVYARQHLRGNGSSMSSAGTSSQTSILFEHMATNRDEDNIFVGAIIDILDFSSSSKNTTIRSFYGTRNSGTSYITLGSGLWNNTAAVTSILIEMESNNFVTGSRFSLYGIK